MKLADADILILPGLGNSGPLHWQRRWAERFSTGRVVEQADWNRPDRDAWIQKIVTAVRACDRPVVLIAHSLAVSAVVHAAPHLPTGRVHGAFLVSPPDHEGDEVPPEARGFDNVPRDPLPFPSLLVASTNDALCSAERALDMATAWGSELHLAGEAGHINVASGHGPWPEGLLMLRRLLQRI